MSVGSNGLTLQTTMGHISTASSRSSEATSQHHQGPAIKQCWWWGLLSPLPAWWRRSCTSGTCCADSATVADIWKENAAYLLIKLMITRVFRIPSFRTKSCGQCSFSYQAPVIWNQLPVSVRHSTSVSSFKSSLKTFLFLKTFSSVSLPWYATGVCVCVWVSAHACVCKSLCVCVCMCVSFMLYALNFDNICTCKEHVST